LPRAALGKGFAEGLRGFAKSLGPSAKQQAPVVDGEMTKTKVVDFDEFYNFIFYNFFT
jgi:hypothetical protein